MTTGLAAPPAALSGVARLARARNENLPIQGPGAPQLRVQGRLAPGPEGLADLMSSIATLGVLHPILVERAPDGTLWLVVGQRRLLASRQLLAEQPDLATLANGIPARVCQGPLTDAERRSWPLIENLGRIDLTPTELGRDLLFTRAAMLAERLRGSGYVVPATALSDPDPITQYRNLDAWRIEQGALHVGAPWPEVLDAIGMQISESRAQQIARAVSAVPPDLAAEMDAAGISVSTRLAWATLAARDQALARKVWDETAGEGAAAFRNAVKAAEGVGRVRHRQPTLPGPAAPDEDSAAAPAPPGAVRDLAASQPDQVGDAECERATNGTPRPAQQPPASLDASALLAGLRQTREALAKGAKVSGRQAEELKAEMGLLFDLLD